MDVRTLVGLGFGFRHVCSNSSRRCVENLLPESQDEADASGKWKKMYKRNENPGVSCPFRGRVPSERAKGGSQMTSISQNSTGVRSGGTHIIFDLALPRDMEVRVVTSENGNTGNLLLFSTSFGTRLVSRYVHLINANNSLFALTLNAPSIPVGVLYKSRCRHHMEPFLHSLVVNIPFSSEPSM
jgi:hypothetical protein